MKKVKIYNVDYTAISQIVNLATTANMHLMHDDTDQAAHCIDEIREIATAIDNGRIPLLLEGDEDIAPSYIRYDQLDNAEVEQDGM